MLHSRFASDAVPSVGAASRRALRLVRWAHDTAPGSDGGPQILVWEKIPLLLADLFADLDLLLRMVEGEVEARGPPVGAR